MMKQVKIIQRNSSKDLEKYLNAFLREVELKNADRNIGNQIEVKSIEIKDVCEHRTNDDGAYTSYIAIVKYTYDAQNEEEIKEGIW